MIDQTSNHARFHIIIPFGGNHGYLQETLESLLCQTQKNWIATVIDDGVGISIDQVPSISDSRIKVYSERKKLGIRGVFSKAIELMQTEYGMILGADDRIDPKYLAEMEELCLKNPKAAILHPKVGIIDKDGFPITTFIDALKYLLSPLHFFPRLTPAIWFHSLLIGNWMYVFGSVFSTKKIKEFGLDHNLEVAMDWDLVLRMAMNRDHVVFVKRAIFYYRRHNNSFSMEASNSRIRLREELLVLRTIATSPENPWRRSSKLLTTLHFASHLTFKLRTARSKTT